MTKFSMRSIGKLTNLSLQIPTNKLGSVLVAIGLALDGRPSNSTPDSSVSGWNRRQRRKSAQRDKRMGPGVSPRVSVPTSIPPLAVRSEGDVAPTVIVVKESASEPRQGPSGTKRRDAGARLVNEDRDGTTVSRNRAPSERANNPLERTVLGSPSSGKKVKPLSQGKRQGSNQPLKHAKSVGSCRKPSDELTQPPKGLSMDITGDCEPRPGQGHPEVSGWPVSSNKSNSSKPCHVNGLADIIEDVMKAPSYLPGVPKQLLEEITKDDTVMRNGDVRGLFRVVKCTFNDKMPKFDLLDGTSWRFVERRRHSKCNKECSMFCTNNYEYFWERDLFTNPSDKDLVRAKCVRALQARANRNSSPAAE